MIYRCDLHIHTALSPCASPEMTPADVVNMAELKGLDVIAITDHQSCGNCASAIARANTNLRVTVVPGLEINSAEEIHLLCLFADLDTAYIFGEMIASHLVRRKNKPHIFGRQAYFNLNNDECGQEEDLLIMPCAISTQAIVKKTLEYGGACIPAHIDRNSFSMLSTFGAIPNDIPLRWLELSTATTPEEFRKEYPDLSCFEFIQGSDAHNLGAISEPGWPLELTESRGKKDLVHNLISALRPVSEQ